MRADFNVHVTTIAIVTEQLLLRSTPRKTPISLK